jgi:hypothetical protein
MSLAIVLEAFISAPPSWCGLALGDFRPVGFLRLRSSDVSGGSDWCELGFDLALVMSGKGSTGSSAVLRAPLAVFSSMGCGISILRHGQRRSGSVSVNGSAWSLLVRGQERRRESFQKLSRSRLTAEATETRSASSAAWFFNERGVGRLRGLAILARDG